MNAPHELYQLMLDLYLFAIHESLKQKKTYINKNRISPPQSNIIGKNKNFNQSDRPNVHYAQVQKKLPSW